MQINHCDICDTVLRKKRHIIAIVKDDDLTKVRPHYNKQERRTYEVCDSCMEIVDKIFEYKKEKIKEITEMIDKMYNTGGNECQNL